MTSTPSRGSQAAVANPSGSRAWRVFLRVLFRTTPTRAMRLMRRRVSSIPIEEVIVVGRRTGQERRLLLTLLEVDGKWYVGHPNGTSQWVRNLAAAGSCIVVRRGDQRTRRPPRSCPTGRERDAVISATARRALPGQPRVRRGPRSHPCGGKVLPARTHPRERRRRPPARRHSSEPGRPDGVSSVRRLVRGLEGEQERRSMATTEVATGRAERVDATVGPVASSRIDWGVTVLSVWVIVGFYLDLWAHAHGRVDDTFLTPWHAILLLRRSDVRPDARLARGAEHARAGLPGGSPCPDRTSSRWPGRSCSSSPASSTSSGTRCSASRAASRRSCPRPTWRLRQPGSWG